MTLILCVRNVRIITVEGGSRKFSVRVINNMLYLRHIDAHFSVCSYICTQLILAIRENFYFYASANNRRWRRYVSGRPSAVRPSVNILRGLFT